MSRMVNARGLGVIGVLMIHATGPFIGSIARKLTTTNTATNLIILSLNQMARYCVPLFFFLSAYLYAKNYGHKQWDYRKFLTRRWQLVGLPYVFWSMLYVVRGLLGEPWSTSLARLDGPYLLRVFIWGEASGHLYFIPALFQFYILLPLFLAINEATRRFGHKWMWILALFLLSLFFYDAKMRLFTTGELADFLGRHSLVLWWLPYLLLGGALGTRGGALQRHEKTFVIAVLLTAASVMHYETYCVLKGIPFYYSEVLGGRGLEAIATFARPSAAIFSLSCLLLLGDYLEKSRSFPESILTKLGIYSFGVYLIHPLANQLVLGVIHRCGFEVQGTLLGVAAPLFLGSIMALIGIVILSNSTKTSWIVGGTRP